jgi:2-amino-4-hydroxy-6-hydroxymethyldihydropteridine diphosphokinase
MTVVYLGLGSNLGNREANLRMAIRALTRLARIADVSSLYESEAMGPPQPRYYNAVAAIETGLRPLPLLRFVKGIEEEIGRRPGGEPNGPRPIDIDILLFGDQVVEEEGLTVPHPRMGDRAFVLIPMAEIAGDVRHPVANQSMAEMAEGVDTHGIEKVRERGWDGVSGRPADRVRI